MLSLKPGKKELSMNRSLRLVILLSLGGLVLAGCAAPRAGHDDLYARLREKSATLDASVLAGRTIVIDPGHGGAFDGALGADSLREADANLGVALYLWGLCTDAGARAHLTRTADRDRLPPGSVEPRDDLAERAAKANELEPDVFLSIHHNSNFPVKRDVNKIEVYYRADDPGPSLELAGDVQVHLARNLGIEISEIKPGNFFVLRHSTARAAILGEASYLSNPAVEERLKLSEKQKLEAEAYFLGLVEYFSRGVPSIARLSPARDTLAAPAEISFLVKGAAGVPLDPASARIRLGDREVVPTFEAAKSIIRYPMPPDLPNGTYRVQALIRSAQGATAWSPAAAILLKRPPRYIIPLPPDEKPGGIASISVRVLDELGLPVADGTPVVARFAGKGQTFSSASINGMFSFETPLDLAREPFSVSADSLTGEIRFPAFAERTFVPIVVIDALTGKAVSRPVVGGSPSASVLGDEAGRLLVPASSRPETLLVSAAGYAPVLLDSLPAGPSPDVTTVRLSPLFGGSLAGRRIALDPGGGGSDPGGRGAGSLRGASVNLAVARRLQNLLERAGASVTLTRNGDETLSAQERVYIVNRADAELAVGIRHGAPSSSIEAPRCVLYFPGSARGRSIAERLASALGSLAPDDPFAAGEWADVFLQQTSCAACEIYCGPIEDAARETAMSAEPWLRLEAERIFVAIAGHFGYEGAVAGAFTVKVVSRGAPAVGATVDIDRLSARATDAGGSASFGLVDPGTHLVTVRLADGRSALFTRTILPNESAIVIEMP
jgi:N-acetylmuramoyl-L-alanine amidase